MNSIILKPQRGKDKMDPDIAHHLFEDVIEVLNKLGLDYWMDYGTLLGAVREGDFIETDFDIDIGIISEDDQNLIHELGKIGLRFSSSFMGEYTRKMNIVVNHLDHGGFAKLELVPYYLRDDQFYKLTEQKPDGIYGAATPAYLLDDFITVIFKGEYVQIPKLYDEYLTHHYGDWRTPRIDISRTYKEPFVKVPNL